jgi:hypothetical protein
MSAKLKKAKRIKKVKPMQVLVFFCVAAALAFMLIFAIVFVRGLSKVPVAEITTVTVSLGAYELSPADNKPGKATKYDATGLKNFLTENALKSPTQTCKDVYYRVVAFTEDRSQVLLSFGCEKPADRAFAVRKAGKWELLESASQFDLLGIPRCSHVVKNNIAVSVAPVCFNQSTDASGPLSYSVRGTVNYHPNSLQR